jgi:hypothetical protein
LPCLFHDGCILPSLRACYQTPELPYNVADIVLRVISSSGVHHIVYLPSLTLLLPLRAPWPLFLEQDGTPAVGDPAERREALFERDLKRLSTRTQPLGTDR